MLISKFSNCKVEEKIIDIERQYGMMMQVKYIFVIMKREIKQSILQKI